MIQHYIIGATTIAAVAVLLSLLLRRLGFKPDPISLQVQQETELLNDCYSRDWKWKQKALDTPPRPINFIHRTLGYIVFTCVLYILLVTLITIID